MYSNIPKERYVRNVPKGIYLEECTESILFSPDLAVEEVFVFGIAF